MLSEQWIRLDAVVDDEWLFEDGSPVWVQSHDISVPFFTQDLEKPRHHEAVVVAPEPLFARLELMCRSVFSFQVACMDYLLAMLKILIQ
jgi:hypothetical protein